MKRIYSRHLLGLAGAAAWLVGVALPAPAEAPAPPAPAGVGAAPAPKAPARVSLELKDVDVEQAAQRLGAALGGEVRLEGPTGQRVTLTLEGTTVSQALERAAGAMRATWRRSYLFTKNPGVSLPPALPTGLTVNLNLSDTSCQAAATIAAKAAGGRLEVVGELEGRVTLTGKEIPVEEAMDRIAQAAGATWRPIYYFKLEAPVAQPGKEVKPEPAKPGTPIQRKGNPNTPLYERGRGLFTGPDGRKRFRSMPKQRRTRYNQLGQYGAKAPPPVPVDVEKMERLSRLGSFAGIFSVDNPKEREERVQRFRAALETQAERLDVYRTGKPVAATALSISQLQQILKDAAALNEEQKKEVAPILEFVEQRLKDLKGDKPSGAGSKQ